MVSVQNNQKVFFSKRSQKCKVFLDPDTDVTAQEFHGFLFKIREKNTVNKMSTLYIIIIIYIEP